MGMMMVLMMRGYGHLMMAPARSKAPPTMPGRTMVLKMRVGMHGSLDEVQHMHGSPS
jgi:hypothetical protein